MPAADLTLAQDVLVAGQRLLGRAFSHIKAECTDPARGRLSARALDERQLVSFDGAFCAAELEAARFMLDYAARARQSRQGTAPIIEEELALISCAEALQNLRARVSLRPSEYGASASLLQQTVDQPRVIAFCQGQLASRNLADVGAAVRQLGGGSGAYLLDEDHELMRETFRQFASDVVMPRAEAIHRDDALIPDAILEQVSELGCFGLSIPERYGGLQSDDHEDNMGMIVVTEELSRGSLGAAGSLITRPEILARALLKGGTEAQKKRWLPKLAAGDPLCAVAVTESDYGSDVAAMKFRATRTEEGWRLEGNKSWCTFGGKAGIYLLLARTDPDPAMGHKGLSIFMVEKPSFDGHDFEYTQPAEAGGGTISGRAIATIGYRGMHSYEVFFDNYLVPHEALLGGDAGLGQGFYLIMAGFAGGRIQTAARACGVMQAAFERAVQYAAERQVFGRPIGDYPLTRVKLARMAAALCAARQFTYGVGTLMDRGQGAVEASMVKLLAARTAEWLTREAMQIHGGMGYAEETAVSRHFVDARVLSIFEGAEEILALKVIARSLIERAQSPDGGAGERGA